jgi:hypothetical protein
MQGFGGYTDDEIAQQQRASRSYAKASDEASADRIAALKSAVPSTSDMKSRFSDAFSDSLAIQSQLPGAINEAYKKGGAFQAAGEAVRGGAAAVPAFISDVGGQALKIGGRLSDAAIEGVAKPVWGAASAFGRGLFGAEPGAPTPSIIPTAAAKSPPSLAPTAPAVPPAALAGQPSPTIPAKPIAPAAAAPAAAAPASNAISNFVGTAGMGGKTQSYTQEQLDTMAGPVTQARYKSPMEIYANEHAINTAHDAYRRGELSPRDYISFLSGQASQAAQLNDPTMVARNKAAQLELQGRQETEALYKQILGTNDPAKRLQLLAVLRARQGKGMNDNIVKLAGRKTKDMAGNETQEAEVAINPDTGERYVGGETAATGEAPNGGKTVTKADLQKIMSKLNLDEKAATALAAQRGYSVI